jgi:hypothetical protein
MGWRIATPSVLRQFLRSAANLYVTWVSFVSLPDNH